MTGEPSKGVRRARQFGLGWDDAQYEGYLPAFAQKLLKVV